MPGLLNNTGKSTIENRNIVGLTPFRRFRTAVELTLKQFAGISNVIVSLDGDPKFADES